MSALERDLNEYLFHELGVEGDEASISEVWPFKLTPIGDVEGRMVFEFDDDEPFFVLAKPSFNFVPKQGMRVADLALHLRALAALTFPHLSEEKANSWAGNSVRKPLRNRLIVKIGPGIYKLAPGTESHADGVAAEPHVVTDRATPGR